MICISRRNGRIPDQPNPVISRPSNSIVPPVADNNFVTTRPVVGFPHPHPPTHPHVPPEHPPHPPLPTPPAAQTKTPASPENASATPPPATTHPQADRPATPHPEPYPSTSPQPPQPQPNQPINTTHPPSSHNRRRHA